jgi:hypothetical protein
MPLVLEGKMMAMLFGWGYSLRLCPEYSLGLCAVTQHPLSPVELTRRRQPIDLALT